MMSVPDRLCFLFISAVIGMTLPSCRDDVDLESDQAVLIEDRSMAHPARYNPERDEERAPDVFRVKFRIKNGGGFTVEVHRAWAPHSADRFYNLTRANYWKTNPFFRVIPGHIVQWGLHASGPVTRTWRKHPIPREPTLKSNKKGYLSFSYDLDEPKKGLRSTQVFVNLSDHPEYDQYNPPFGRVIDGLDALTRVYPGYGDIVFYGNRKGVDSVVASKRGAAYFERNFPFLSTIRSTQLLKN